jgi:hypothetical protein
MIARLTITCHLQQAPAQVQWRVGLAPQRLPALVADEYPGQAVVLQVKVIQPVDYVIYHNR